MAQAQTATISGDGLFNVSALQLSNVTGVTDHDLDTTTETRQIWDAIDAGAGTGLLTIGGTTYNVADYETGTASRIDYGGSGGDFATTTAYSTIGGGGVTGGDDFSIRAQAYLALPVGTYSIAAASDDGRYLQLAGLSSLNTPNFTTQGGQISSGGTGFDFIQRDAPTGHNNSVGVFTVDAADLIPFGTVALLTLDALMFERAGSDSLEISITNTSDNSFDAGNFEILDDNDFGIRVSSTPFTIAYTGAGAFTWDGTGPTTDWRQDKTPGLDTFWDSDANPTADNPLYPTSTDTATVSSGQVNVTNPTEEALTLTVNGTGVVVVENATNLSIGADLDVDGGGLVTVNGSLDTNTLTGSGTIELGTGATLTLESGEIGTITATGANATVTSNDNLTVNTAVVLNSDTTFNQASGTLSLANVSGGNIIKNGAGDMVLSTANTYVGTTEINGGIVTVGHSQAFGSDSAGTTIASGAGLLLTGGITSSEPIQTSGSGTGGGAIDSTGTNTLSGAISLAGDTTIRVRDNSLTMSGTISESGGAPSLTKTGTGILELSGNNTYNGDVTVDEGTVRVTSVSGLGTTTGGTTLNPDTTLELSGGIDMGAEDITMNGATITGTGGNNANSGDVTIGSLGATFESQGAGNTLSISGTVALDPVAGITLTGSGDVILTSDIGNGTGSIFGGLQGNYYDLGSATNALIDSTNAGFVGNLTPDASIITPRIDFGDGTESTAGDGTVLDRGGSLDNVFGGIGWTPTKNDDLAAYWTGKLRVPVGFDGDYEFTIRSDDGMRLWIDLDQNGLTLDNTGGDLIANNPNDTAPVNDTGMYSGVTAGEYDIAIAYYENGGGAASQLSWALTSGANAFSREIIAPTALGYAIDNPITKTGSGTATLAGNNTYNGLTDVQEGTLIAANSLALGTTDGSTAVADGATLALTGGVTIAEDLTLNGNGDTGNGRSGALLNLSGTNTVTGTVTAETISDGEMGISSDSGTLTISGDVDLQRSQLNASGDGDLVIDGVISGLGSGVTVNTIDALDAYAYDVTGNNGDIRLSDIGLDGSNAGGNSLLTNSPISRILIDGADLIDYRDDNDFRNGDVALSSQGFATSLEGLAGLNQNDNFATHFEGDLNVPDLLGGGAPYNIEFGTNRSDDPVYIYVDLDGDGIYETSAGEQIIARGCCGDAYATISVTPGTYRYLAVQLERGGGSQIEPTIDLTPDGLGRTTIGADIAGRNGLFTVSTNEIGDNQLVKTGSGTLRLNAANTYDGLTDIQSGILIAANDNALGDAAAGTQVAANATLALTGNITIANEALTIQGTGAGGTNGAGALTNLSGTNTIGGTLSLAADATIDVATGSQLNATGVISGIGGLVKSGSGTLQVTETATYQGPTSITSGTMRLAGTNGNLTNTPSVDIAAAAVLEFSITPNASFSPNLTGTGTVLKNTESANTVELTGNNTGFTGQYRVDTGTLAAATAARLGRPSQIHVEGGATFDLTGIGTVIPTSNVTVTGNGVIELGGGQFLWNNFVTMSPGNSPGTFNFTGNLIWDSSFPIDPMVGSGGDYIWEITSELNNPSIGAGTNWDLIDVNGILDISGPASRTISVSSSITPTDNTFFEILTATTINLDPLTASGGVSGTYTQLLGVANIIGGTGWSLWIDGNGTGNTLYLGFNVPEAIPEPGTWALFIILVLCGLTYRNHRSPRHRDSGTN